MTSAERERLLKDLLRQAKKLAVRYYVLTGMPLGVGCHRGMSGLSPFIS